MILVEQNLDFIAALLAADSHQFKKARSPGKCSRTISATQALLENLSESTT